MDTVFKALSDPHRRRILQLLKKKTMTAGELHKKFAFTGASLSHHLDILKRADLVAAERRGRHMHYSLNTSVLEEVLRSFFSFFSP